MMRLISMINNTYICLLLISLVVLMQMGCDHSLEAENSVAANSQIVADFRRQNLSSQRIELDKQTEKSIISKALGDGVPDTFQISDVWRGAITGPGRKQTLYMIVKGDAVASSPKIQPPFLVLFEDSKLITQFVPSNASYRRFAGSVDMDNDGVTEILLQVDGYQMGHHISTVDLYSFNSGKRKLLQHFENVFEYGCEAPDTDGLVRASVLQANLAEDHKTAELQRTDYIAPCLQDGSSPALSDYKPVESAAKNPG